MLALLSLRAIRGGNAAPAVRAYVTTADASSLLARDASALAFSKAPTGRLPVIAIDDRRRYQSIDGFGAVVTGSSAYLLAHLPDHGAALLDELFDARTGIGLSYVRMSIGASDFSLGSYSYDDIAPGGGDRELRAFSVARDADLFAALAAIQRASPDVRFMASPWTAPAWMKTNQSLFGGELRPGADGLYARYLLSYLRELERRGIPLDALTPQNEPLFASATYPSMRMSAVREATFVRTALGPALLAAFPATKLVIGDHNWDARYPLAVLRDRGAARYISGSAFHCYAGNVAQMSVVGRAWPQRGVYVSECSGGDWSKRFGDNLSWDMRNLIVGGTLNGARTIVLGNLALDDAAGPANGGCANCRGVVTIHADGTFSRNVEYYVLAQAAKFVRPGAVRIASSDPSGGLLPNVAFANPDGSDVAIVFNAAAGRTSFAVRAGDAAFSYTLPAGAVVTFIWN